MTHLSAGHERHYCSAILRRRRFDPRVLGAGVGRKLFVELLLKIPRHFIGKICQWARQKGSKHPSAFGATPPHDALVLRPVPIWGRTFLVII